MAGYACNTPMARKLIDMINLCSHKTILQSNLMRKKTEANSSSCWHNEIMSLQNDWARRRGGGLTCFGIKFHGLRNAGPMGA